MHPRNLCWTMSPKNNELEQKAIQLVFKAGEEGMLQSTLWKSLGLSSREGSRIAQKFEEKNLVERRRVLHEGRWTYKLYSTRHVVTLKSIKDNPCISCEEIDRCFEGGARSPITCEQLSSWIVKNSHGQSRVPG